MYMLHYLALTLHVQCSRVTINIFVFRADKTGQTHKYTPVCKYCQPWSPFQMYRELLSQLINTYDSIQHVTYELINGQKQQRQMSSMLQPVRSMVVAVLKYFQSETLLYGKYTPSISYKIKIQGQVHSSPCLKSCHTKRLGFQVPVSITFGNVTTCEFRQQQGTFIINTQLSGVQSYNVYTNNTPK